MSTGTGDACYLARDLGNGSYGGDVHCLQRFFARKGYLQEEATGYYGERTATAARVVSSLTFHLLAARRERSDGSLRARDD